MKELGACKAQSRDYSSKNCSCMYDREVAVVTICLDRYILDVLMRDLTEHEKRPSAFIVYLHIWRRSLGAGQRTAPLSYQEMAEGTGLSKSAVQSAVRVLKRRRLISVSIKNPTSTPIYRLERPWVRRKQS